MSSKAVAWALTRLDLITREKLVLTAAGDLAGEDGYCRGCSPEVLAKRCSLPAREILDVLGRLVDKGLIQLGGDPPASALHDIKLLMGS